MPERVPSEDPVEGVIVPDPPDYHNTVPATLAHTNLRKVFRQFETALGGRDGVVEALAIADQVDGLDPELVRYVVGLLADPRNAKRTLNAVAKAAGITFGDLLKIYQHACVQRAHLESLALITRALPQVVGHVMGQAVPYELPCPRCAGVGQKTPDPTPEVPNPSPADCPDCRGAGRFLHQPELDKQKLALQLGGLLKSGGGVQVNVHQQQGVLTTPGEALVKLQQSSDRVLYGKGDPLDEDPLP